LLRPYIGKEEELEQKDVERIGFFCGKKWKSRNKMYDKLEKEGIEFIISNQGLRFGKSLKVEEYLHRMMTSKYGIVLKGRGSHCTEAKNRREIDYMILRKPLLLNYKPTYYNPLVENIHYIYIDENTDFGIIDKEHDIDQIAANAFEWYKENASPMGAAKTFKQIMKDRFEKENEDDSQVDP